MKPDNELEIIKSELEQTITGLGSTVYKDNPMFTYPNISVKTIEKRLLKTTSTITSNFTHEIEFEFDNQIISSQFNYEQVLANSDTNLYSVSFSDRTVIMEVIFEDSFTQMNLYDNSGTLIQSNNPDLSFKSYADCLWDGMISRYQSMYGECIFEGKLGKCAEAAVCTYTFL